MKNAKSLFKVLLIAIDDYPSERARLRGCKNDVRAFQAFLETWVNRDNYDLCVKQLFDDQATYQNIQETFLAHFKDLKDGDVGLVYYSGHGSQTPAPAPFWHTTANKKLESLVCHDSRLPGGKDLIDKELGYLIWKVTEGKKVNFTVILDACHAGSGTRTDKVNFRRLEEAGESRPLTSYLGYHEYLKSGNNIILPVSNHILLAACEDFETAKEKIIQGRHRGVFSYGLLQALQKSEGRLTYQSLMRQVQAQVNNLSFQQHPQLEPVGTAQINQYFLSNALSERLKWSLVNFDKKIGWIVHAGTMHGIPAADKTNITEWEIFPINSPEQDLKISDKAVGTIQATLVGATKSKISGMSGRAIQTQYKAVLSKIDTPRMKVFLASESDDEAANLINQEKEQLDSLFFEFTKQEAEAKYSILAKDNLITVLKSAEEIPIFEPLKFYSNNSIYQLFKNLETIAQWHQVKDLTNPSFDISDDDVEIKLYEVTESSRNGLEMIEQKEIKDFMRKEVVLRYHPGWEDSRPVFRCSIKNTTFSRKDLYVSALFLGSDFVVDASLICNKKIKHGETAWFVEEGEGTSTSLISLEIEKEWKTWEVNELMESIKIIVSTTPFNAQDFEQNGLPLAINRTRADIDERGRAKKLTRGFAEKADWRTYDFAIKIVEPSSSYQLQPNNTTSISLFNLKVTTPNNFSGNLRIGSSQEAYRLNRSMAAANNLILPPFAFSPQKGNACSLDVIELYDVHGADLVTEANPIIIDFEHGLAENNVLLSYGFSEELGHFVPLGFSSQSNRQQVIIEKLPDPQSSGYDRSLGRALKLFFYKTTLEKIDIESGYPRLAIARIVNGGTDVLYYQEEQYVKEQVAAAKKIVLFIHGIIGNTKEMTLAAQKVGFTENESFKSIEDHYDLILTFDYECLQTPIEETAKLLKKELAKVGLDANHGKTVHIIAHSMGGLVARWMIEKMEGYEIVGHLIQLGAPNAGSTWSKVQDMAKWLLTFAFGKLTIREPLLSILAYLGSYAEKTQVTFEQMNPNSDFYKRLNDGTTPKIPYIILAGNTQKIEFQQKMKAANFFQRIGLWLQQYVWYQFLDKVLFHEPNDIAVTVKSIHSIPTSKMVDNIEILTDHISYFQDRESLKALGDCIGKY